MPYTAVFSTERWNGLPNLWIECDGIRVESNLGICFVREMCRALRDAGRADGPMEIFRDGQRVATPWQRLESIYQTADGHAAKQEQERVSSVISEAMYEALTKLAADTREWPSLHGRLRGGLLDKQFVRVVGENPQLTPRGRAAMRAYQKARGWNVRSQAATPPEPVQWWLPKKSQVQSHPPKPTRRKRQAYPRDFSDASQDDLLSAAETIGLTDRNNLRLTLKFIETTISVRSPEELRRMAERAQIPVPTDHVADVMQLRRMLAAIANAGKLAEVV